MQTDNECKDNDKFNYSGSTAVIAVTTPNRVYIGNTGDSRAVMSVSGSALLLTEDHKPWCKNKILQWLLREKRKDELFVC